jgi:hypothetical protein
MNHVDGTLAVGGYVTESSLAAGGEQTDTGSSHRPQADVSN